MTAIQFTVTVPLGGMSCTSCEAYLETLFTSKSDWTHCQRQTVKASASKNTVTFQGTTQAHFSSANSSSLVADITTDIQQSLNALDRTKYTVGDPSTWEGAFVATAEFTVDGMRCGSCAKKIESHFESTPLSDVEPNVTVSIDTKRMTASVRWSGWKDPVPSLRAAAAVVAKHMEQELHYLVPSYEFVPYVTAQQPAVTSVPLPRVAVVAVGKGKPLNFLVEGMTCASCASRIENSVRNVEGVVECNVNFASSTCVVSTDSSHRESVADRVEKQIVSLGYRCKVLSGVAKRLPKMLLIGGMTCASCASRIEVELARLPQLESAAVNFATASASLLVMEQSDEGSVLAAAMESVKRLGYECKLASQTDSSTDAQSEIKGALERTQEIKSQLRNFWGSFIFTIPLTVVMIVEMSSDAMMHLPKNYKMLSLLSQLVLASIVVMYFGSQFFIRAFQALRHCAFTMDTLVSIGVGTAYLFSVVATALDIAETLTLPCYYDSAAMLVTFMLLGRFLEAKAKRHTSSAMIKLMNLMPSTATVVELNGNDDLSKLLTAPTRTVPSATIEKDVILMVLPSERIPADGVVVHGDTDIDEQLVTGESVPRAITVGDRVTGGTLNLTTTVYVQALRVGEETTLSQILRIVQEAQGSKPAIQRIADRIAGVFVPFVVVYSVGVLVVWLSLGAAKAYPDSWRGDDEEYVSYAFSYFIATIVAACPCALGLATPTAVMVGTGVGASNSLLVKSGVVLEVARSINCVVFDKTGTLTEGKMRVVSCTTWGPLDAQDVKMALLAVEGQSTHPIAKAIVQHLQAEAGQGVVVVQKCTVHSGRGMEADLLINTKRSRCLVGSLKFLQQEKVPISNELLVHSQSLQSTGITTVFAAVDGVASVAVGLADSPKSEALAVVEYLQKNKGIRVLMVSGDHEVVARRVGVLVGIHRQRRGGDDRYADNVVGGVQPQEKAAIVQELQEAGYKVAFVGDGVNDSPALAQADLGVALGAGTEVAIEAADVVLMRSNLIDMCTLLKLATVTVNRIYANFVWAFGYNMIILPVASGVLYPAWHFQLPPVVAGIAMISSSLSVLASSLLLRCFAPVTDKDIHHRRATDPTEDGISMRVMRETDGLLLD